VSATIPAPPLLAALAEWVVALGAGQVPVSAAAHGRALEILLDDLAAAIGAVATDPAVGQVAELAARRGGGGASARLWAGGRAEPGWAALANAVACSWIELDEGYRLATCRR
jgi:2-methylcitrate dehydratase PrpD